MIGKKITHLCKLKNVTLRAACQAAGLKYSTLHAQISNNRPIPFGSVDKLSRALNVPISYFSDGQPIFQLEPTAGATENELMVTLERTINQQTKALTNQGLNIKIDDVLDWLVHEDFRLTNADWIKDCIDLYHPLQSDEPMARPYHVGRKSLAAQFLGFTQTIDPNEYYSRLSDEAVKSIRLSYEAVEQRKYSVVDQEFDAVHNGVRLSGSYRKLMAGVSDENGSPFTLVFCRMIRFING